ELVDQHPGPPGHEEVAQLMDQYEDAENEDCRQYRNQPRHRGTPSWADSSPEAYSRAHRSAAKIPAKSTAGSNWWAAMVASTMRGMWRNPTRPARKASTATSLAALSTAGMVPP